MNLGREALLAMRAVAEAVDLAREVERDVAAGALSKGDASPVNEISIAHVPSAKGFEPPDNLD